MHRSILGAFLTRTEQVEVEKGGRVWSFSYHKKVRRSTSFYQSTKKPYTRLGEPRFTKYKKVSCIKRHTISIYLLPRFSWPKIKWPKKKKLFDMRNRI